MNELTISLFRSAHDNEPRLTELNWAQLVKKLSQPVIRRKKDGSAWSPATFKGTRAKENVTSIACLVLDYDHKVTFAAEFARWKRTGHTFCAHTTHTHQRIDKDHPRKEDHFRIIVPLSTPIPPSDFPALWQWAYEQSQGRIDTTAKDSARLFYWPAKYSPADQFLFDRHDGELLDWRKLNLRKREATNSQHAKTNGTHHSKYGEAALEEEFSRVSSAPRHTRNITS
jgi:hypothetical protein